MKNDFKVSQTVAAVIILREDGDYENINYIHANIFIDAKCKILFITTLINT